MDEWFKTFFDKLYYETYRIFENEKRNEREAEFIRDTLNLPGESRILDLGCGYARHATYLAKWGYRLVCYDLSDYLLEKARERIKEFAVEDRVEIIKGDMRRLDYTKEFDGAYMFFTTFGYFSDKENLNVLERISKALKPGGVLLIDLWNPISIINNAYLYDGIRRTWFEAGDYIILEETNYNIYDARVYVKRTYYRKESTEPIAIREFKVRYYMYWELKDMTEKAGLKIERALGSYRGEEYKPSSPRLIIISRNINLKLLY